MNKLSRIIAIAALAATTVPATFHFAAAQSNGRSSIVLIDHNMRASKLIGMTVTNAKGEVLGTIAEVLVKGAAAEPMVVLQVDATKMVGIPMSHLAMKDDKITMPGTKTEVMAMPKWEYSYAGLGG